MDNAVSAYLQQKLPFWDKLSAAEQQMLLAHTALCKYDAGQNVHSSSNESRPLWLSKKAGRHGGRWARCRKLKFLHC